MGPSVSVPLGESLFFLSLSAGNGITTDYDTRKNETRMSIAVIPERVMDDDAKNRGISQQTEPYTAMERCCCCIGKNLKWSIMYSC